MFVLDIKTGAILKTLEAQGVADTNGLPTNGLSSIRGADNNSDGIIDYAYAGDLQGNLWRFDLIDTAATNPFASTTVAASTFKTSFGGNPLYVAKDVAKDADGSNGLSQPITAPPSLVRHPSTTGYLVIFGTGRYLGTSDKSGPFQLQTLYGIWDKKTKGEATTSTPTLARSNLQVQTISEQVLNASFSSTNFDIRLLSQNTVDWTQQSGWYLDLKVDNGNLLGERIVDEMAARGQTLLLSTRTPNSDVCQAGVDGWSYGIDPYTGGRANFNVFDLNQNFVVDQGDAYSAADGSKMVSGYKTPAGGSTLSGNTRFNADGSPMNISFGPESTGRQTWRVVPQ
ncbi:Type IV pilus biogenesis factor PilY1 [compost metagenome]